MEQPIVSVPVITYNSERTVIETLDSIKAQTYPSIELIISDDCSLDNTVELCREWVKQNKSRFVRSEIITNEKNKGVSANFNRADNACAGEWVKPIAGDDVLLPNCVQDCVGYVMEHPETIYLFGKHKAFGVEDKRCKEIDAVFDYSFFDLTQEQQLRRLIFEGNCIPATTVFYHRKRAKETGVSNDERIPLLEDWPKWINLLRAGVKFHFENKEFVKYRVGGLSTQSRSMSVAQYHSERLVCFFYQYPEWYKENPEKAVERVVRGETEIYKYLIESENQLNQILQSKAYRLGKMLLKPFRWLKK